MKFEQGAFQNEGVSRRECIQKEPRPNTHNTL